MKPKSGKPWRIARLWRSLTPGVDRAEMPGPMPRLQEEWGDRTEGNIAAAVRPVEHIETCAPGFIAGDPTRFRAPANARS